MVSVQAEATPALDSADLRTMDATALYNTIARGRYGTTMAAFSAQEGGILTPQEINNLLALIQYGSWPYVQGVVAALGLTPPELVTLEVTEALLSSLEALPSSENLGAGVSLYAANCVACHGANLAGTHLAPALSPASLDYADMTRIIMQGVNGTLMAGWEGQLSATELNVASSVTVEFTKIPT
ncbi:MAG: hypothetical protein HC915_08450 [Anaerolineae bacterium]|nr:hypothetical protein [Anaerolineae bacterium]